MLAAVAAAAAAAPAIAAAAIAAAATAPATTAATTTATGTASTTATTVAANFVGREGPEGGHISNFSDQREPLRAGNRSAVQYHHGKVHAARVDARAVAVLAHTAGTNQSAP